MKKSEFEKKRAQFWHDEPEATTELIKRDVWAASAAGVVWDPEEEPLPEKLRVSPYAPLDTSYIESDGVYWLCINNPRVNTLMGLTTAEQRLALAREAVRRYNLFPELERLASGRHEPLTHARLIEILESGKP